jgi:hypothetical protein
MEKETKMYPDSRPYILQVNLIRLGGGQFLQAESKNRYDLLFDSKTISNLLFLNYNFSIII